VAADRVQQLTDAGLIDPGAQLNKKFKDVINALTPNEAEELISLKRHLDNAKIDNEPLGKGGQKPQMVVIL